MQCIWQRRIVHWLQLFEAATAAPREHMPWPAIQLLWMVERRREVAYCLNHALWKAQGLQHGHRQSLEVRVKSQCWKRLFAKASISDLVYLSSLCFLKVQVHFFLNRRFQVGTCCTKENVCALECSTTAMQNSFPFSKSILCYIRPASVGVSWRVSWH